MPVLSQASRSDKIRSLNDKCRNTFTGCTIVTTAAFADLETETKTRALENVRSFTAFDGGNDPHHEHDMAFFDQDGERYFWKFDYYADDMQHGSDDPSDTSKTRRVLTIGLASDY